MKPLLSIQRLRNEVNELLIKDESNLKELKKQDFLKGDIHGDNSLHKYGSLSYEAFKSEMNPIAGGSVDLILTGAFVESAYLLKPNQNKYLFGFTDGKSSALTKKYGTKIKGLNQGVFNKYQIDIVAPKFKRVLKKQLGQ
jgi:hypothetical protein